MSTRREAFSDGWVDKAKMDEFDSMRNSPKQKWPAELSICRKHLRRKNYAGDEPLSAFIDKRIFGHVRVAVGCLLLVVSELKRQIGDAFEVANSNR